jgi:hypothetical protein
MDGLTWLTEGHFLLKSCFSAIEKNPSSFQSPSLRRKENMAGDH